MPAIQKARNNVGWMRLIAAKYEQPVSVMRRMLRTQRALNEEVARLLNDAAQSEAVALVAKDARAPIGDDLYTELVRRHHAALFATKKKRANEEASKAMAAEVRQHRKRTSS